MKTTFKVLTAISGLGLLILIGLHLFLQYGLTKTLRDVVLPRIKSENGIDVRVGRLSINLPNGILYLNGVEVKNPEGFLLENLASIERVRVEVDLYSLLKQQPILVKNIEVKNARLNVIRNQNGEINLNRLQDVSSSPAPLPAEEYPALEQLPDADLEPAPAPEITEPKLFPEVLVEALQCRAKLRYVDFKLDELDIALDLSVIGSNLSTQRDPSVPWGELAIIGSLGNKRTCFVTDLRVKLAPLTDLQPPSFDLTGRVMEIDPRIMEEAYNKLGIRSAPFGLDPSIHCRSGRFQDSVVMLTLTDIELEDKLADRLGGMASVGTLRFPVAIEGTFQEPTVDLEQALYDALGGNVQTLLSAFLKGAAARETGLADPQGDLVDSAVVLLGEHVDEIGESETIAKVLQDLANGEAFDTNTAAPLSSDTLIDILGEHVEEVGENEELKSELKNLGKWLFGQ